MLNLLEDTITIAKKDLLEFTRDKLRLLTFVIMPIFMMTLTGFIFPSQNSLKDISIGIVDGDHTSLSGNLMNVVSGLKNDDSHVFKIKTYQTVESLDDGIKKQDINGGLVIPAGLAKDVAANQQVAVTIVEDQSNPQISALTDQVLQRAISGYGKEIGAGKVQQLLISRFAVLSRPSPLAFLEPITTTLRGLIGGTTNYFDFVAPGIMAMVVMTAVLTGLAGSVARENEQGTLVGILIAPIRRLSIILGKALAQSVRGMIQGLIVLALSVFLFGVTIHGSLLLVALILALGIFSFVGLGILVSAAASEQETATQLLFMFQFPMLFLSGAFFPLQQMPDFMQGIAHAVPLYYAINALRKVMVLGGGLSDIQNELLILLAFGAVTLVISLPLFNRLVRR